MIKLEKEKGELTCDEYVFFPKENVNDFKNSISPNQYELLIANAGSEFYRISNLKNFIIQVLFNNDLIKSVHIYPEKNSLNKDEILLDLLIMLGGKHDYVWGKVDIFDDKKAGCKSLSIYYK